MEVGRIYHMDGIAGMEMIEDKSIDMILCDLPYGVSHCRWDQPIPLSSLWKEYERIIKDAGAIVLTACQPFTTLLIQSNRKLFRYCWYWRKNIKTGFASSHKQPMRCIEDIAVFYKRQPVYNPQGLIQLSTPIKSQGGRKPGSVYRSEPLRNEYFRRYSNYPSHLLEIPHDPHRIHPTQKPVALFEYLIRTYTNEGALVLDNCMGSGTTAVACIRSGRRFNGFEKDTDICTAANERITNMLRS